MAVMNIIFTKKHALVKFKWPCKCMHGQRNTRRHKTAKVFNTVKSFHYL